MEYEIIEINKENINEFIGLDIVAFHWAAPGACGEHGGVIFITRDSRVFHTNYVSSKYGITDEDLCRIFPSLSSFSGGTFGGGNYPTEWKDQYLGLGNYLVVHESIWDEFIKNARTELARRNRTDETVILYNIWIDAILKVI